MIALWLLPIVLGVWAISTWIGYYCGRRSQRGPWYNEGDWHVRINDRQLEVRRRTHAATGYTPARYSNAKTFRFDPADADSYAEALAQADDSLTAMRYIDKQARELSAR